MKPLLLCLAILCVPAWTTSAQAAPDSKSDDILLEVDASDAPQKILHAHLTIPVQPGPLTLYYPKWIPGTHGPYGPIAELAGLKLNAGGKRVPWRRDDVDMYAFHCTIPDDARTLDVSLDLLAATGGERSVTTTQNIAVVRWNEVLVYPKGKPIDAINFQASVKIPSGWQLGTALPVQSRDGMTTRFDAVSLDRLVDSPVLAGRHFREIRLGAGDPPHYLELASDSAAGLEITPKQKAACEKLVAEAGALFGSRHYKSYRFLVTLSDKMPPHGLEHHESSDDGLPERAMADDDTAKVFATLLPHEYVHSWNGKFRRPAGLVTPTYQEANNTRLLWVYEGLTEYLGTVLAARSGLWTPQETRDYLGVTVDQLENTKGRAWRPLEDTTLVAPMKGYEATGWNAWRRSVDYYDEGTLIWLEVDTKIRQLTQGARSLDDFCRRFHGGSGGRPELQPYDFDDVVNALNEIAPFDWKSLLSRRLTETTDHAPLAGVEQSGWRLAFADKPTAYEKAFDGQAKRIDASASIGLVLGEDGNIVDVIPGKPAGAAGIGPGMKLIAVNTRKFSPEILKESLTACRKPDHALALLVENGDFFKTYTLDYHAGPRHPRLERIKDRPDLLDKIIAPLTGNKGSKHK